MAEWGRVIVIGDVMTDVIVRAAGPIRRGSDQRAAIDLRPGGSGANQACWLAALGAEVTLLARVGAEDHAAQARAFATAGVHAVLGADAQAATGRTVTLVGPDNERSFLTDRGANALLQPSDLPEAALADADLLQVSGYSLFEPGSRAAVLDFAQAARRRGIKVTLDTASASFLRNAGAASFLSWSAGISIGFANEDEARVLAGSADLETQVRALTRCYGTAVIKRGAAGAVAASGEARWSAPAGAAPVIDTTGAGDAFLAGYLVAHLQGGPVEACLQAGTVAGARAVRLLGGRPDRVLPRGK